MCRFFDVVFEADICAMFGGIYCIGMDDVTANCRYYSLSRDANWLFLSSVSSSFLRSARIFPLILEMWSRVRRIRE